MCSPPLVEEIHDIFEKTNYSMLKVKKEPSSFFLCAYIKSFFHPVLLPTPPPQFQAGLPL
jgi:hypothetical protein